MQSALSSSCRCGFGRPVQSRQTRSRPQRAIRLTCRANGSLNTPHSLIGCHSQVWVGGWDEKDIRKSCEGTTKAGFDLIEGMQLIKPMHRFPASQESTMRSPRRNVCSTNASNDAIVAAICLPRTAESSQSSCRDAACLLTGLWLSQSMFQCLKNLTASSPRASSTNTD